MIMHRTAYFTAAMLIASSGPAAASSPPRPVAQFITLDVDRFYAIYDAAKGAPSGEVLQRDYIDAGSEGVRQFVPNRIKSGQALAERIARDRPLYDAARSCANALPAVRPRVAASFRKLGKHYPEARFPPVYVLIGRNNSAGTTGPSGVLIGLEVVCRPDALGGKVEDRLVHIIAHEYAHIQQFPEGGEDAQAATVLSQSLVEGVAELLAELTSGRISNVHLLEWTKGREAKLETAFLADQDAKDLSKWLYNDVGTPDQPGDLGYWVGYRIAKSYYRRAKDKRAALRELILLDDPKKILADSGWRPGMSTD